MQVTAVLMRAEAGGFVADDPESGTTYPGAPIIATLTVLEHA